MPDLGFALATAAVKCIARVWVNENSVDGIADDVLTVLSKIGGPETGQRRVALQLHSVAETIGERITPLITVEMPDLDEGDRTVAVETVEHALQHISITTARDLIDRNMNATHLAESIRKEVAKDPASATLSEAGLALQERLLVESALYVLEITTRLPNYTAIRDELVLARSSKLEDLVEEVLSRLPRFEADGSRPAADEQFEHLYRIALKHKTDQVRLFGLQGQTTNPSYPLSVAYISLTIESLRSQNSSGITNAKVTDHTASSGELNGDVKLEDLLRETRKLMLVGGAGSGKTTLLNWIALSSVSPTISTRVPQDWKDRVPFVVPLRQFVEKDLPSIDLLSTAAISTLTAPPGWPQRVFASGRATLLIDGLDEVNKRRRAEVHAWLNEITAVFPETYVVVSTRPTGLPRQWADDSEFTRADIQEMRPVDIRVFVQKWHHAAAQAGTAPGFGTVDDAERAMQEIVRTRPAIRALSNTPLLCALVCALHFKQGSSLPRNRIELYDTALVMLLAARDNERKVEVSNLALSQAQRRGVIRDFALWMHENGLSDASSSDYEFSVASSMQRVSGDDTSTSDIAGLLLERSGVLREPAPGRVDFVHRTFLEYLAAYAIVEENSIDKLVLHAENDQWREVIILAAGVAQKHQRERLLRLLLSAGRNDHRVRHRYFLLAIACLETAPELPLDLRQELEAAVSEVVPPRTMGEAVAVASAGELAVPLLVSSSTLRARAAAASVRALCIIGTDDALESLSTYKAENRVTVSRELLRGWPNFDPDKYASNVLSQVDLTREPAVITDPALVPHLSLLREDARIYVDLPGRYLSLDEIPPLPRSVYGADLSGLQGLRSVRDVPISNAGSMVLDSSSIESLDGLDEHPSLFYFSALNCSSLKSGGDLSRNVDVRTLALGSAPIADVSFLSSVGEPIGYLNLVGCAQLVEISEPVRAHSVNISDCDALTNAAGLGLSSDTELLSLQRCPLEALTLPPQLATLQLIMMPKALTLQGGADLRNLGIPLELLAPNAEWIQSLGNLEVLSIVSERLRAAETTELAALSRMGRSGTGPTLISFAGFIEVPEDVSITGYTRERHPQRSHRFAPARFRRNDS